MEEIAEIEELEREELEREELEREDELILPNIFTLDEEEVNNRYDELVRKNSIFDINLIDKNIIKILSNHNFFSFPSDFNDEQDYQRFSYRISQVKNFINQYYNKIKNYADVNKYYDFYNIASLKPIYQNENENIKRRINDDIGNFNVMSLYLTNLLYLDDYITNQSNTNQSNTNQSNTNQSNTNQDNTNQSNN